VSDNPFKLFSSMVRRLQKVMFRCVLALWEPFQLLILRIIKKQNEPIYHA